MLKIDDLLQYLGSTKVALLKDELCQSLNNYDFEIKDLKEDLQT